jgi:hypothetical protein
MAFVPFKPKGAAPAAPGAAPAVPPGKPGKKKLTAFQMMKAAAAAKKPSA